MLPKTNAPAGGSGLATQAIPTEQLAADFSQFSRQDLEGLVLELQQSKADLEAKRFVEAGLSRFASLLRWRTDDSLQAWASRILEELVVSIGGLQACLYMTTQNTETGKRELHLAATYAFESDDVKQVINFGEGIIGQAAASGRQLHFANMADTFATRSYTSLAIFYPRSLLIQPLIYNDVVEGIIELSSITELGNREMELVRNLSENLAATLMSVRSQEAMKRLYREAQEKTEALLAGEEEMRQNLEELEATQEEMRRVQGELEEKQRLIYGVISNIPNTSMMVFNHQFRYELVGGDELLTKLDFDPNAIRQSSLHEYWPAEVVAQFEPLYKDVLEGKGHSFDFGWQGVWLDFHLFPVRNSDGQVLYGVVLLQDITEQKQQALAVEQSEYKLNRAMDIGRMGYWEMDLVAQTITLSDRLLQIHGGQPSADGKGLTVDIPTYMASLQQTVHPEDLPRMLAESEATFRGDAAVLGGGGHSATAASEYRALFPDGSIHYMIVRSEVIHNDKGKPIMVRGATQDITEQKAAEAELRIKTAQLAAQEEELRQNLEELEATQEEMKRTQVELADFRYFIENMLNSTDVMFIATDNDGIIKYWNRASEQYLGYTRDEIVDKLTPAVFHDLNEIVAEAERLSQVYNDTVEPGFGVFAYVPYKQQPYEREWTYVHKNGTQFPVRLAISAWKKSDGSWGGLLSVATNISKEKAAAERTDRQEAALLALAQNAEIAEGNLDLAFRTITAKTSDALQVQQVGIWRYTGSSIIDHCTYNSLDKAFVSGAEFYRKDIPKYFKAIENGDALISHEVWNDDSLEELMSYFAQHNISSMLDVPIRRGGQLWGILSFEHCGDSREWQADEVRFAQSVADTITLALEAADRKEREQYALGLAEELRKNAALTSGVLNNVPRTAFMVYDREMRYVMVQGAETLAQIGIDADMLRGRTLYECWPEVMIQEYEPLYKGALEGQTFGFEYPYGDDFSRLSIYPVRDENGKVVYGVVSVTNITEEYKARQASNAELLSDDEKDRQLALLQKEIDAYKSREASLKAEITTLKSGGKTTDAPASSTASSAAQKAAPPKRKR